MNGERKNRWLTFPNLLTGLRIFAAGVVIWLLLRDLRETAISVFILALLTDTLDGYLARKLRQVSKIGEILDPVADRILIIALLATLYLFCHIPPMVELVIYGAIEVVYGLTVLWLRYLYPSLKIQVNFWGKARMALGGIVVFLILIFPDIGWLMEVVVYFLIPILIVWLLRAIVEYWEDMKLQIEKS